MVRNASSGRDSGIEQTTITINPVSKQISSEYPSSDDVSKEVKKSSTTTEMLSSAVALLRITSQLRNMKVDTAMIPKLSGRKKKRRNLCESWTTASAPGCV